MRRDVPREQDVVILGGYKVIGLQGLKVTAGTGEAKLVDVSEIAVGKYVLAVKLF